MATPSHPAHPEHELTLAHDLLEGCKFELRREAPGTGKGEGLLCDACGTGVHGWYYHCDNNGLDLHPCCAKLPMEIEHGGLTFELRKGSTHTCSSCGRSGGYGTFWYYRSKKEMIPAVRDKRVRDKRVYLHVRCVKKEMIPAGGGSSTSTTADYTTRMISFVQTVLEHYRGERTEQMRDIVPAIVSIIVRVMINGV